MILVALCATRAWAAPDPRHIVVLDFDGREPLAERGHTLVVALIAEHHDLVPTRRWMKARTTAAETWHGPAQWAHAAEDAGVDAVIEGFVADDHGHSTLTVVVREARSSQERTTTTVRFDASGTIPSTGPLRAAIESAIATIDPVPVPAPEPTAPEPTRDSRFDIAPRPKHESRVAVVLRPEPEARGADDPAIERAREPRAPDRFAIEGGGYLGSRSLAGSAIATHGVQARAEVDPIAEVAISGSAYHSVGSSLTFVDVTAGMQHALAIDQHGWELAAAYRRALDPITVEAGLSYGGQAFAFASPPASFAVPATHATYLGAGARVDVRALDALSLGLGARYLDVLGSAADGLALDGAFAVALPARLFVRGQLAYRRIADSQITFHLNLGVAF